MNRQEKMQLSEKRTKPTEEGKSRDEELRTVSVDWLMTGFRSDIMESGLDWEVATMRDIKNAVLLEKTMGTSYVQSVKGKMDTPSNSTGIASYMLSYTWGYKCKDIAEALSHWCEMTKKDPKETFVWICAVCINQHKVETSKKNNETVSFSDFKAIFGGRVKATRHVLALLAPWDNPENLSRAWCVFELHTCILEDVELDFIMPPHQNNNFSEFLVNPTAAGLHEGLSRVFKSLQNIDIEKAEATEPEDKKNINEECKMHGVDKINASVKQKLRKWFSSQAYSRKLTNGDPLPPAASLRVGVLMSELNEFECAEEILMSVVQQEEGMSQTEMESKLLAWHELGWIEHKRHHYENAIKKYDEGFLKHKMYLEGLKEGSSIGPDFKVKMDLILSKLYRGRGRALVGDDTFATKEEKVIDDAESDYLNGLRLMKEHNKEDCIDGAKLNNNLGLCYAIKGDYSRAMLYYEQARTILENINHQDDSTSDMRIKFNIGCMHLKKAGHTEEEEKLKGFEMISDAAQLAMKFNEEKMLYDIARTLGRFSLKTSKIPQKSSKRLLCLDLDGTLYNSKHIVSQTNASAISAASRAGWIVALCTGRGLSMSIPTARELGIDKDIYLVGCNGAVVYKMDRNGKIMKTLYETQLTSKMMSSLLNLAGNRAVKVDANKSTFAQYRDSAGEEHIRNHTIVVKDQPQICNIAKKFVDDIDVATENMQKESPNKLSIFTTDPAGLAEEVANKCPEVIEAGIAVVPVGPFWVETMNTLHDKAAGIKLICDSLDGIDISQAIAFGDGSNDISMLRECGIGIAMAQANPGAKAAANRVSLWTNDEDAIAHEIKFLLSQEL